MKKQYSRGVILTWMRAEKNRFIDPLTGECNATQLAEAAADRFTIYENTRDYTIPEYVFELSANVADES